jgi:hypothetical protein
MPSNLCTAAELSPEPERQTAAQGVGALNSGDCGNSLPANFQGNVTAGRRFASRLKLQPIWSDGRYFVGWLSDAEAAALSQGERT